MHIGKFINTAHDAENASEVEQSFHHIATKSVREQEIIPFFPSLSLLFPVYLCVLKSWALLGQKQYAVYFT